MNKRTISRIRNKAKKMLSKYHDSKLVPTHIPAIFNIDNPIRERIEAKKVIIEGWLIPDAQKAIVSIRARFGGHEYSLEYGKKRKDVARVYPNKTRATNSGFFGVVDIGHIHHDTLIIEVDLGNGFQEIYSIELDYSPELLVGDLYNHDLAVNMAEHLNLLDNKKKLFYEEPIDGVYKRGINDPRVVAFYLPQFHPIAENDKVWGKGFTEWTNVTADTPRFVGHQQPILPSETGFYDLRLEQNMKNQIDMAKKHGVYGFCFYYYWFSGKRLLENPLDTFVRHKDWDFNFTICWANENWTKRWDGRDNDVIVAQKYEDDDPLKFIKDVEDILLDARYIRQNGKPVLVVFRASELKEPEKYSKVWREYFVKKHKVDLHLVSIVSFEDRDPREYGFDMALDFAPQSSFFKNSCFNGQQYPTVDVRNKLIDKNFIGTVADYREIALNEKMYDYFDFPSYKSVTPSWDNDARKKGKGFVMTNENPDIYRKWLEGILKQEISTAKSPLIFINAWNEWAEGAILEPSRHYGSAVLNRTTEVLAKYSSNSANRKLFKPWSITRTKGTKLAVIVHLYYTDRWGYIEDKLRLLDKNKYDLFVTINEKDVDFRGDILKFSPSAWVQIIPNRGRDILPFVYLLGRLKEAGYEAILKIHSKKSTHRENGSDWFENLVGSLLHNKTIIDDTVNLVMSEPCIVGPSEHYLSLKRYMGSNEQALDRLLGKMLDKTKKDKILNHTSKYGYFAGSMFWANINALSPLMDLNLIPEDFESEKGQIDGTLAHAIERLISLMPGASGNPIKLYSVGVAGIQSARDKTPQERYDYAE